jgi:hypothetical protein
MALSAVGLSKIRALNFERYGEKVFTEPTEVGAVCGCALMVWRDLLVELGGLDEDYFMYFEETDLCVRVSQHGKEVHHAPVGEFLHEDGGTSKTVKLRTFLDFCRSEILFHQKHGGTAKAIAAPGLLALAAAVRVPPLAVLSLVGSSKRHEPGLSSTGKDCVGCSTRPVVSFLRSTGRSSSVRRVLTSALSTSPMG